ncbi:AraC family transcriptional regulator [Achromobacter denitrificans]|uniref:AraC family transcriptional regulator n=1 Tax=Achromobacter denitrificans TaxID=32002 RepID=UPI000F68F816|nr:AraC family transcriptional regulator [Achromobacter denitrificans]RSE76604.1 AraC family transcriptional regulator [Achromobacter denitrificans]
MPGVPAAFDHPGDRAEFRQAPHRPGVELYRAHIIRHAFEPHTHEAYGLGAIESGVERFRYRGSEHLAPPGSVVLMNPDELHTGRAETEGGWRYRMAYLDPHVVAQVTGDSDWWFDTAVGRDAAGAQRVTALLDTLWQAREPLAFDSALYALLAEFRRHARMARPAKTEGAPRFAPVIDYLRAHLSRRLTLNELAAVAGLSPFHFLRSFQAEYHATPQQMLMALRLFDAKRRLAAGEPPAQVALAAGLTDQAHLTRAFSRRYGVTPARYQKQVRS